MFIIFFFRVSYSTTDPPIQPVSRTTATVYESTAANTALHMYLMLHSVRTGNANGLSSMKVNYNC